MLGGDDSAVMPGLINAHHHASAVSDTQQGRLDNVLEPWLLAHAANRSAGSRRDSKSEQTSAHATAHTPQGSGSLREVSRDSKTAAPLVTPLGVSGTPSNTPQPSRGDTEPFDWIPGAHDDATFRF